MTTAPFPPGRWSASAFFGAAWLCAAGAVFAADSPSPAADESDPPLPVSWAADAGAPTRLAEPVLLTPITGEPGAAGEGAMPSTGTPLADLRVAGFLAVVFAAVAFLKWGGRRSVRPLPTDVFAVLGEAPLGGQHVARIVRFGSKTILVGVSGATCTPLAEIDDPAATERIVRACDRSITAPASDPAADRPAGVPARSPRPRPFGIPVLAGAKEGA